MDCKISLNQGFESKRSLQMRSQMFSRSRNKCRFILILDQSVSPQNDLFGAVPPNLSSSVVWFNWARVKTFEILYSVITIVWNVSGFNKKIIVTNCQKPEVLFKATEWSLPWSVSSFLLNHSEALSWCTWKHTVAKWKPLSCLSRFLKEVFNSVDATFLSIVNSWLCSLLP